MSESPTPPRGRRRRFAPLMLIAGLAGAIVLSLSMTSTLSAFVASITNSNNTAAAGSVVLQETGPSATCNSSDTSLASNSFSCATINKYGGSTTLVPSNAAGTTNTVSTTVTFKNTGTAAATSFTLAPGACTQTGPTGGPTDFCSKLDVIITVNGTARPVTNAAALATGGAITLPVPAAAIVNPATPATTVTIIFTVYLDTTAGNTYQTYGATQPLVWSLSS